MKRVLILCLVMLGLVAACGERSTIAPGHTAGVTCVDGSVVFTVSNYGDAVRVVDGGIHQPFNGGFTMKLSGTEQHTMTITADDWPTWDGQAGPCPPKYTTTTMSPTTEKETTTTEKETTTTKEETTTTTVPDGTTTSSSAPALATTTSTTSEATTTSVVAPPVVRSVPPQAPAAPPKGLPVTA